MPFPLIAGGAWAAAGINALRLLLMAKAGAIVGKVFVFFGLTWGANKYAITPALDFVRNHMANMPAGEFGTVMVQWLGVLQLDTAVSMVLSAYVAAWTIKSAKVFLMRQPI